MKIVLGILLGIILLSAVGIYALNKAIYDVKQERQMEENTQTITAPSEDSLKITPISHATMILNINGQVIYTDPVGGADAFSGQPEPHIVLITDIHGDHFDLDTLSAILKEETIVIMPQAVADQLPQNVPGKKVVMKNGDTSTQNSIIVDAIPMYNYPESADSFHTKGRGNGYVLSADGKRIYIAGDTSATPEMKALQNIDVAFIPMNLPYTMDEQAAADAVVTFKPKVVHPYHYRGQNGFSDVNKFKELVEAKDPNINVELLNFYPGQ